jgi:ERCC4-related helicase
MLILNTFRTINPLRKPAYRMPSFKSGVLDNHKRGKVGDFLKEKIEDNARLSFVSAFFTIYAYEKLKDRLNNIEGMRFLFGEPRFTLDPDQSESKAYDIEDNQLKISNRLEQKAVARECSEWIKKKVQIRSMTKSDFLHGKMYHVSNPNGVEEAIIGSSNFTVNGLGLGAKPNIELNLILNDRRDNAELQNWFEELWCDEALTADVKDRVLKYLEQLYTEQPPEFIYFKTLFHIFEEFLLDQQRGGLIDEKTGFYETKIWKMLYQFQKDGVKGAINKINKYNGCIIADSVGLGKTFEALAVIKYFEMLNCRILVLCPKKLRNNWVIHLRNDRRNLLFEDRFSYSVLCHTDLSRGDNGFSGDVDLSSFNWGNFDLVVIDESHNFRNSSKGKEDKSGEYRKSRYEKLMDDILKSGRHTRVLLLSATPVNNNLRDLRNQIYLVTQDKDDAFSESLEVKSIYETMRNAQTHFTNWANPHKTPDRKLKLLLNNLGSDFFTLLDSLTISRSRKHIESYYNLSEIGTFPERLKPISIYPEIDLKRRFPSYDKIEQEIRKYALSLFNPSKYVKEEYRYIYAEKFKGIRNITAYKSQENREHFLIGMMKVNFLKRLESSIKAFEISMGKTVEKMDILIRKITDFDENYDEYTQPELFKNLHGEESEFDPEDEAELSEQLEVGKKLKFKLEHIDTKKWLEDINKDREQINLLSCVACSVDVASDAKLKELKSAISGKLRNPLNNGNKKVLIFTAFSDTAKYLYSSLEAWTSKELGLHIALITGSGENKTTFKSESFKYQTDFESIITNFSPISKSRNQMPNMPQDGEIDILIATDCISEGQNLQDCDCVVNYDIHWNPVRIIQRFGRIDRIGSKNGKIQMVNFWPTQDLNKYIKLKERVESKMALVNLTATGEDDLLNQEQIVDLVKDELTFRQKQLVKLKDEILDLEEMDDNVSLSEFTLDDFRIDLLNYLESNRKALENAPFGLYSVVPTLKDRGEREESLFEKNLAEIVSPGVVFCLKHKSKSDEASQVNPLNPYFLVYIRDDGEVRYRYTSVKQILKIFQTLCSGREQAIAELCDIFNSQTKNGADMSKYNGLLMKSVKDIVAHFEKRNISNLFSGRGGKILPGTAKVSGADDFELVTWLVIK